MIDSELDSESATGSESHEPDSKSDSELLPLAVRASAAELRLSTASLSSCHPGRDWQTQWQPGTASGRPGLSASLRLSASASDARRRGMALAVRVAGATGTGTHWQAWPGAARA